MRCAIVHYWLLKMRGGERVVEALCRLLPGADVYTLFYDAAGVSETIRSHRVVVSGLNGLRRYYRGLLPLMPVALESFDLRGYDLVVSSESGPAKGVLVPAGARHVCYCHSPMRYLWELYPDYLHDWTVSKWKRWLMALVAGGLRVWDYATAARVDAFVANSENVRRRIRRAYGREAEVVYPPVAVEEFYHEAAEDYFLVVSELVRYKRTADAVRCFTRAGRKLKIVGEGPEYGRLKKMAGRNVEFCGAVTREELRGLYARCRALVMPQEEDFGMTAVEAQASGKAVVALGRGGVIESVPAADPVGGVFYDEAGAEGLERALKEFERIEGCVEARRLQERAARFSEGRFAARMAEILGVEAAGAVSV
jgi:glycosyltransferase involved in cell wall biosynthesis